MSRAHSGLWIAGTILTGLAFGLLSSLPPVPSDAASAPGWVEQGRFQLTWSGEVLFFAVIAWGVGARGVYAGRPHQSRLRRDIASVGLGVTLVAFVILLLALGRLVYPVIQEPASSDTLVLVISVMFGSLHLALLGLAVVAAAFPVWARTGRARWMANLGGVLVAVVFVSGSFPWAAPAGASAAVAVLIVLWGASTGGTALAATTMKDRERLS